MSLEQALKWIFIVVVTCFAFWFLMQLVEKN